MSQHRPGDHSRQIDVRALRAWIAAGRPGSLRTWWHQPRRRRPVQRQRWIWWPTVTIAAVVMAFAVLVGAAGPVVEHVREQRSEQRVAKWCISCHGQIQQGASK